MECSLDQRERRALGHDHALVHHDQPVAQLLGLVHVVRGDHQRDARLLEPEQLVPQQVPGLRVEAGGRLVEQQQVGPVDQGAGDRQPPLHAAGEVLDLGLRLLGELHELQQLVGPLADLGGRDPEVAAVDVEVVEDVELGVEGVLLRADAEPAADRRAVASPGRRPRIRSSPPLTGETAAIIRMVEDLPAPFGPEEAERLALAHRRGRCPRTASKSPNDLRRSARRDHQVLRAVWIWHACDPRTTRRRPTRGG